MFYRQFVFVKQAHLLSFQLNLDEKEVEPAASACSLVPYTVDLRDVGYGKRIIAPKSYAANYCSGSCSFPLQKVTRIVTT